MSSSINQSNGNYFIVHNLESEREKELLNLAECLRKQLNFMKSEIQQLNEDVKELGQEDSKLQNLISESEKNNSEKKIEIKKLKLDIEELRKNVSVKEMDRDKLEIASDRISEQKEETKRTLDILCDGKYDNLDENKLMDNMHQETKADDTLPLRKSWPHIYASSMSESRLNKQGKRRGSRRSSLKISFKAFLEGLGSEKKRSEVETSS